MFQFDRKIDYRAFTALRTNQIQQGKKLTIKSNMTGRYPYRHKVYLNLKT